MKTTKLSRIEFNKLLTGLEKAGFEHLYSVMDDSGTGGLFFMHPVTGEKFTLNSTTREEARRLAGLR